MMILTKINRLNYKRKKMAKKQNKASEQKALKLILLLHLLIIVMGCLVVTGNYMPWIDERRSTCIKSK